MSFASLFPHLQAWVLQLAQVWPAPLVKQQLLHVLVVHLLSLAGLGGCVLVVNLRLLGLWPEESPSRLARTLQPVQALCVAGVVVTGVLITMSNPQKVYPDPAFLAKMAALAAGLVATYGASLPVARADGEVGKANIAAFLVALAGWAAALWVFATSFGASPGTILVLAAAALLLAVTLQGRVRLAFLAGLAVVVACQQVVTHGFIGPDDVGRLDPVNKAFSLLEALWVLAFAGLAVATARPGGGGRPWARAIALSTVLIWVTVAAAGRWIAFS